MLPKQHREPLVKLGSSSSSSCEAYSAERETTRENAKKRSALAYAGKPEAWRGWYCGELPSHHSTRPQPSYTPHYHTRDFHGVGGNRMNRAIESPPRLPLLAEMPQFLRYFFLRHNLALWGLMNGHHFGWQNGWNKPFQFLNWKVS